MKQYRKLILDFKIKLNQIVCIIDNNDGSEKSVKNSIEKIQKEIVISRQKFQLSYLRDIMPIEDNVKKDRLDIDEQFYDLIVECDNLKSDASKLSE